MENTDTKQRSLGDLLVLVVSQSSLLLYLGWSFLQTTNNEIYLDTYNWIALLVTVLLCMTTSFFFLKKFSLELLAISGILVILMLIGLLNADQPVFSFITFAKYVLYLNVLIYILSLSLAKKLDLLQDIFVLSVVVFLALDAFNVWRVGNPLLGLYLIQLPLWLLALYCCLKWQQRTTLLCCIGGLLVFTLVRDFMLASKFEWFRIQFLPIGLIAAGLIGFFSIEKFRSNGSLTFVALLSIILILINLSLIFDAIPLERRAMSFLERLNIFKIMFADSFGFFAPQGLGASMRLFDLGSMKVNFGNRLLYPSHSGLATLLHENSIIINLILLVFVWLLIRKSVRSRMKPAEPALPLSFFTTAISNKLFFGRFAFLILTFWFLHNLFYLKGTISPDYFSDDGILIYGLVLVISYEARCRGKHITPSNVIRENQKAKLGIR